MLLQVLKERGVDTRGMKLDDMRKELASHEDFKSEKHGLSTITTSEVTAIFFPSSTVNSIQ